MIQPMHKSNTETNNPFSQKLATNFLLNKYSLTNLNKSLIFNQIHTNQEIQIPVRNEKTRRRDFRGYPGQGLQLSHGENFRMINHSTFKYVLILKFPNLTYYCNPNTF